MFSVTLTAWAQSIMCFKNIYYYLITLHKHSDGTLPLGLALWVYVFTCFLRTLYSASWSFQAIKIVSAVVGGSLSCVLAGFVCLVIRKRG